MFLSAQPENQAEFISSLPQIVEKLGGEGAFCGHFGLLPEDVILLLSGETDPGDELLIFAKEYRSAKVA